jgi:hypothetical protein
MPTWELEGQNAAPLLSKRDGDLTDGIHTKLKHSKERENFENRVRVNGTVSE